VYRVLEAFLLNATLIFTLIIIIIQSLYLSNCDSAPCQNCASSLIHFATAVVSHEGFQLVKYLIFNTVKRNSPKNFVNSHNVNYAVHGLLLSIFKDS